MTTMRRRTVEQQMLPVLSRFRERYGQGEPLEQAFREAAREVANEVNVTHQTIDDGFTRRSDGVVIGEVYARLREWTNGNSELLASQLKASSERSAHASIDAFFRKTATSGESSPPAGTLSSQDVEPETFSFDLSQNEARMLRAFAANNGVSEGEFVSHVVRTALAARLRAAAQELMR
jgi:hypothetical protein